MGTVEPPVIRRSLRILAKQKLKEDQELQRQREEACLAVQQSGASLSVKLGNNSNSVIGASTAKGKELATPKRNRKPSDQGGSSSRKRKRTTSPSTTSPSTKPAKKSPVSKDSASSSATGSFEGPEEDRVVPRKKRKQETTQKGREERETVIVEFPRKGKSRSKAQATTEHSELETELEKTVRSKRRRSKGKSKTHSEEGQAKGKGRSTANSFSLPSLEDFQLLDMASPE